MLINADTKISELIKANPASIDAIAEINKHFRKLKNPILRKTLARRVTIRDAAKIGGVEVGVFFNKLSKIGFEIGAEDTAIPSKTKAKASDSLATSGQITDLDVRDNIAEGNDPFKIIMAAIKKLPDGEVLRVINIFEPIPLINVLKEKGYDSRVERPEEGVVYTYFKKRKTTGDSPEINIDTSESGDFRTVLKTYSGRTKTIDVRAMEMPEPMVTVLSELEVLPKDHALFVHHKKFPKFLIPELKNRGYQYVQQKIDENNIDFLFFKME